MHPQQPNMQDLVQQTRRLQAQIDAANAGLEEVKVVGTADSGLVSVGMAATGDVQWVRIDPRAIEPDAVPRLEGLIVAAFQDATGKVRGMAEEMMRPILDDFRRS
jgi:nucleoid-associated protein EbfC